MLYRSVRVIDTERRLATFADFVGRHIYETALGAFRIAHFELDGLSIVGNRAVNLTLICISCTTHGLTRLLHRKQHHEGGSAILRPVRTVD